MDFDNNQIDSLDIAIINMDCRFPGADTIEQYWDNLKNGVESIHFFNDEELIKSGVSLDVVKNPKYIKAAPVIKDIEFFDAEFFNINPADAETLDPQRRIFLECCWNALEGAGYDPEIYKGVIGVFAGAGPNSYFIRNIMSNPNLFNSRGHLSILINNEKDHLPTQVSYQLNLSGPSINVNTACSSSLVAIHLARQSILLGECDMTLAGGSAVVPYEGYIYEEGSIYSPDGHCRTFDADAKGMLWGSGCGVVLLKRLEDAVRDGDNIYAVIKGSAINNDGSNKIGFTAPSILGQANVIIQAYSNADVDPSTITYIEAHGTGTEIGDPIEIEALTQAFRMKTEKKSFCAVGSVKSNFGHLGAAAGIAGIIKTVLALKHKQLVPTLHYKNPNPKIDFDNSPFYVSNKLTPWKNSHGPLRAGVSSLAVGGTNAHVILEEYNTIHNKKKQKEELKDGAVLILSARTPEALDTAAGNLADYLESHTELSLADVAYTLQCRRRVFQYRMALKCFSIKEAIDVLREHNPQRLISNNNGVKNQNIGKKNTLDVMMREWLEGKSINWESLYDNPSIVYLPTYPFQRRRYWIDVNNEGAKEKNIEINKFQKKSDIADFVYTESWKKMQLPLSPEMGIDNTKYQIIFADKFKIGYKVADCLREKGYDAIIVTAGDKYNQIDENNYTINPIKLEDYYTLFTTISKADKVIDKVMHFWSLTQGNNIDLKNYNDFIESQNLGYFSILYFIQAINSINLINQNKQNYQKQIIVFSNNFNEVYGNEKICTEKTSILGVCKVAQQEYPNLFCRVVDISTQEIDTITDSFIRNTILYDIMSNPADFISVYKENQRWILNYEPIRVEKNAPSYYSFKENDVYLFYGGLYGIPNTIAHFLLDKKKIKLLIIDDYENFPAEDEWEYWLKNNSLINEDNQPNESNIIISQKIQEAKVLQSKGAVYIGNVIDLKNKAYIQKKIKEAEAEHGEINGVFHCAGGYTAGKLYPFYGIDHVLSEKIFLSNAYSMVLLDDLFMDRYLDFRIVFGSLSCMLGGPFMAGFTAANHMLNTYALAQKKTNGPSWAVQHWDLWETEYRSVNQDHEGALALGLIVDRLSGVENLLDSQGSLSLEEGLSTFERVFTIKNLNKIIISASDLQAKYDRWVKLDSLRRTSDENNIRSTRNERPNLKTPYEEPRTEIERILSEIFKDVLSINKIGIHDNFYELGGHSLAAVQVASMLRDIIKEELQVFVVLENPTISKLAHFIEDSYKTMISDYRN